MNLIYLKNKNDAKKFNLNLENLFLEIEKKSNMSKNFYITTPIYYPSAKPHMGHAYST